MKEDKPAGKRYKKTTIQVEVISDGYWEWGNLYDVVYAIDGGPCSGAYFVKETKFLSEEEAAEALEEQGTDPEFLLGPHSDYAVENER